MEGTWTPKHCVQRYVDYLCRTNELLCCGGNISFGGMMDGQNYWMRFENRVSRRRLIRSTGIGSAGLAGAALIGCGGEEQPTSQESADETTGGTDSPSTASGGGDEPVRGGTFNYYNTGDPQGFDPLLDFSNIVFQLNYLTHNSLLRARMGTDTEPDEWTLEVDLAESYESPDESTRVFTLPPNAKFHDGGDVTADDVVASYERIMAGGPSVEKYFLWQWIESATALDDRTVELRTDRPYGLFDYAVAWQPETSIVSQRTLAEEDGVLSRVMNGTGPFKLDDFTRNSVYRLVRHDEYFKDGFPYLDRADYHVLADSAAVEAAFRSEQIDDNYALPVDAAQALADEIPTVNVQINPGGNATSMHLLSDQPPFNDRRLRNAVSLALDREHLVAVLTRDQGYAHGPLPRHIKQASPDPMSLPNMQRDLEEARSLVSAAGADDLEFTVTISAASTAMGNYYAVIQEQLAEAGINLQLEPRDHAEYLAAGQNRSFQIYPVSRLPGYDAHEYSYAYYEPGAGRDFHNGRDAGLIDLANRQAQTSNSDERLDILRQFEEEAATLNFIVTLFDPPVPWLWHDHIRNYRPHMSRQHRNAEQMWKVA